MSSSTARDPDPASDNAPAGKPLFGHPRGLMTLFFTEMWERFTYYGMRALLVLFLADAVDGGFGLDDKTATAIYGLYISASYILCLPGGWIADRLIGARRAVFHGGILIAIGNLLLAIGSTPATFYGGLIVIVFGVGLLKPNISAMVADLYPEGGGRRDAGFTIFYMGINLGAFLGPILTGWLAVQYGWRPAFAAGGILMAVGCRSVPAVPGASRQCRPAHLECEGRRRGNRTQRNGWLTVAALVGGIALAYLLCVSGVVQINPLIARATHRRRARRIADRVFRLHVVLRQPRRQSRRKRMVVILFLFVGCALFWAGFEQTGASLNLFAERYVDRTLEAFNFEIPAAWFQSLNCGVHSDLRGAVFGDLGSARQTQSGSVGACQVRPGADSARASAFCSWWLRRTSLPAAARLRHRCSR